MIKCIRDMLARRRARVLRADVHNLLDTLDAEELLRDSAEDISIHLQNYWGYDEDVMELVPHVESWKELNQRRWWPVTGGAVW